MTEGEVTCNLILPKRVTVCSWVNNFIVSFMCIYNIWGKIIDAFVQKLSYTVYIVLKYAFSI